MKPNVLFLIIDSFRSDKCYGPNKTSVTPNLDKLIKQGVYFSQAISSAPASIPAVSSILSGLFPFKSLELQNNVYNLKKNLPNIVEKLKNDGYVTYATIPNILKLMNLSYLFGNNIESYEDDLTLYDGVGEKILKRIDFLKSHQPWFYYLHLNDIHGQAIFHRNNTPEEFYDKKLGKNQYERMVSLMDKWLGILFEKIDLSTTLIVLTADHGSDVGTFDEKMEEMSKKAKEKLQVKRGFILKIGQKFFEHSPKSLAPLRKYLSQKYRNKRTSIIEKQIAPTLNKIDSEILDPYRKRLFKNMLKGSVQVFDEKFRIPLIFSGYGIKQHCIIEQQVRSVDIFPTVLEILGYSNNFKNHGKSLTQLLLGKNMIEEPAYLESHKNVFEGINHNMIGIRTSQFKYFRNADDPTKNVNLYDLKEDPSEELNIANQNKQIISEMENLIKKIQNLLV